MVLDRFWIEAHAALLGHGRAGDRVLLPEGDWPAMDYRCTAYRSSACALDPWAHDLVLIHKGMIGSFRQSDVRGMLASLEPVFANAVFVLFAARARGRTLPWRHWSWHLNALWVYADPARYRRRGARSRAFVHIAKAGGTSAWGAIAREIRSRVYFSSDASLAAFDGDLDAFEAVGGHFHVATLGDHGWDHGGFFIVRDPVARMLSFLAHASDPAGNVADADPAWRIVREAEPGRPDAPLHALLLHEANAQVRVLGARTGNSLACPQSHAQLTARALAMLAAPGWRFGLLEHRAATGAALAEAFGLTHARLPLRNRTDAGGRARIARWGALVDAFVADNRAQCHDCELVARARAALA